MTENEEISHQLKEIIKSDIALAAIFHTIHRVKQFNNGYFPFQIKSLGIGGSSLRSEKPKDIDLFVEAHAVPDLWQEWNRFKETLNSKMCEVYNLAHELCGSEKKAIIEDVIEKARDRLIELGFESSWIKNWLPMVRISDIKWGLDRGGIIAWFSERELISRFIKEGWRGKRLEIHVISRDLEGKIRSHEENVPWIMIWNVEKGIIIPSTEDINKHFQDEYSKLRDLSKTIIETVESADERKIWDLPQVYQATLQLLKSENKFYKNILDELKRAALSEIGEIKKLVQTTPHELVKINTALRKHLDRFVMIGLIYEKIGDLGYELSKFPDRGNIRVAILQIFPKRLSRYGYQKEEVTELLEAINWGALIRDLMDRA